MVEAVFALIIPLFSQEHQKKSIFGVIFSGPINSPETSLFNLILLFTIVFPLMKKIHP